MSLLSNIKKRIAHLGNEIQKTIVDDFMNLADAKKVSEAEFKRRIALCEDCDEFNPESRRCKICTCFMDVKGSLEEMPFSFNGKDKKIKCSDLDNPKW